MHPSNTGFEHKKHIITIAGRPGSGKSTTAKEVAKRLGFQHFSSGDLYRELGKERGANILQAQLDPKIVAKIDELVDGKLRSIGIRDDRVVIDSRIAWHWIPNSFKVFLNLDLETAAKRILNGVDKNRLKNETISLDPKKYAVILAERLNVETVRYKKVYGIDLYDMSNYNLVVDTSRAVPEEVVNQVANSFKDWIG